MNILVCGGREFSDYQLLSEVLNDYSKSGLMIIHGGARGADSMAGKWAEANGVHSAEVRALWADYGKSAGFKRNSAMLNLKPDLVLAFSGGVGTKMMVDLARRAGVEVVEVN